MYKYLFTFNFKKQNEKNPCAYYFCISKANMYHIKSVFGIYKRFLWNINSKSLNLGYIYISID